MPSCNDSIGTFCAWWILMKYSAQISLWWLYLFYSKVKEDFLERSGIRIMLMLLCNKFENLCGYFSCWKEKALRSCNDGLLQLFGNKSIKRVSADEKQIGFMHLIDSAESKGSLYTREIFDYAIQPIKQGTCNLLHKACIVSCNVKKNAKSNLEIIKKFIYNLFLRKFIWFKQKAMLAYNFAIDIIKMIAESIRKYCTLVVEFIKNTYNSDKVIAVRNTIWRTRETILYTMNTFVSAVNRFISTILNAVNSFISAILNAVNRFISAMLNAVNRFISAILYAVNRFISAILYAVHRINSAMLFAVKIMMEALSSPGLPLFILIFLIYFIYAVVKTYKGYYYYWKLVKSKPEIREGCKELMLEDVTLKECMSRLLKQINLGLNHKTREKSSVKCFVTYVQDLPTGNEKGKFLALDLGGTNFRVLLIKLDGRHYHMESKIYAIPQNLMTGPGSDLFEHIANCLDNFTKEHKVNNEKLGLGFTFSFPLFQQGLGKGVLVRWTKGFKCEGVVDHDVVELLRNALDKKMKDRVDIVAILNDTTGTLMSCAWKNHNCKIGLILGTGTNACYVEKIENIPDFDGDHTKPYCIINTEWGAFGDNGELDDIRTSMDVEIDRNSINPGKQIFEKMISGMYLGEIVRLIIVKFVNEKILFDGKCSETLRTKDKFLTEYVSDIESDQRGSFKNCKNILGKLGITNATDQDCANVRYICECASRRAANLASAGLAALLNKMQLSSVTVGVDGTLYRKHPYFHDIMMDKISDLVDPTVEKVFLMLSSDGSGRGAALVAATASLSRR